LSARRGAGFLTSVVIPVYNGRDTLEVCLKSLFEQDAEPPHECIVVDDGSTDGCGELARQFGCLVIRQECRKGPAAARNLGARAASGDILVFLDADVRVHSDTVRKIRAAFLADPQLDALIGSYDDDPSQTGFLSQYRNLMHYYVHQTSRREACTFWSGCGALWRDVFLDHGGYDQTFERPSIEDIELGYRLKMSGLNFHLERDIQVQHLKKWTLFGILKTDVRDRGIPWTELILRAGQMPNDLNLRLSQRVSVILAFALVLISAAAAWLWGGRMLLPQAALLMLALARYLVETALTTRGAAPVAAITVALSLAANQIGMPWIMAPVWTMYALLMLHYGLNLKASALASLAGASGVLIAFAAMPKHWSTVALIATLAVLIALNRRFYAFLASKRGWLFMLSAVPFHLVYHLYSGLSFAVGIARYTWRRVSMREPLTEPQERGLDS